MSISVYARAVALLAIAISIPAGAAPRVTGVSDDLTVGTGSPPAWSGSGGQFAWSSFAVDSTGLSATSPDASFHYAFESARVAGSPLAATSATPALDATGAVLFDRGAIRERYVALPAGVEQFFDIDTLPALGDLVVRGAITGTAAFDASRSSPSLLTYGPFTVGNAVAYDASGASIALALAHVDGGLEITVPAGWLATAALPVTIDPFITTETPFDTPASGALPIRTIDVAHNATANEYFIVYSYQPAGSTGNMDVFGRRVDATTGTPLGTPIAIEAGAAFTSREPAVAWNSASNTYLVAFADSPVGTLTHVMGRVLDATGADTGAGKFSISPLSVGPEELWPDVAFDGTNYLVVWGRAVPGIAEFDVHGQRVSGTGALVGGVLNLETTAGADARRPCVAFAGTYLAAWSEATPAAGLGTIRARTVSTAGALGATSTLSTNAAQDHDWPHAAAAASEFVVVWDSGPTRNNNIQTAPSPDLNFRRVSSAGTPLGGGQVSVVSGTTGAQLGDVAWSSVDDDYVIVWMSGLMTASDTQIRLARVNAGTDTLPEVNTPVSSPAGSDDLVPAIAARGGTTECLIAWSRLTTGAGFAFFERLYQTSNAPPGGGGGGGGPVPVGRDNPNGNQLFNDTLCGDGASAHAGSLAWMILVLAAALELVLRRHSTS